MDLKNIYSCFIVGKNRENVLCLRHPTLAWAYFKNYKIDLLTGKKYQYSLVKLLQRINALTINRTYGRPLLFIFCYEFSYFISKLDESSHGQDDLLAVEVEFAHTKIHSVAKFLAPGVYHLPPPQLEVKSSISFESYQKIFLQAYQELKQGNSYQLNLTFPYIISFRDHQAPDFFPQLLWQKPENRSAYAHFLWIPFFKKMFLSNSPECLFKVKKNKYDFSLLAMPIKGTLPICAHIDLYEQKQKLKMSRKDEAELNMISDLLRNDLSRIELPNAKIVAKKKMLRVPGLLHQYSIIKTNLSYDVNLGKIIEALFPGGSITGAPKKNAIKILRELEGYKRGFYTGTTVLFRHSHLDASINIRSAVIDFQKKEIFYGAGGGITLNSEIWNEYREMQFKMLSFFRLLSPKLS